MGQIKNIKLHIVTDIKLNAWTLTLPPVIDATSCKRHPIPQANMNGHSDTEEGMVNGDAKDALSSVLGTPKPMSALPRIPKKKKEGGDELVSPKKEVKKEEDEDEYPMSNGNGKDSPDEKVKVKKEDIKEEEMDSEEEDSKHKSRKRKHDDDDDDEDYGKKKSKKKKDKKKSKDKDKSKDKSKEKEKDKKEKAKGKAKVKEEDEKPAPKKKKKEEEEEVWRWWDEEPNPEGVKWKTLQHSGPFFPPEYEPLPKSVKFYYDGEHVRLSQDAEEVATFYSKMLEHDYTKKDIFNDNFFEDWRKEMTDEEREVITDLSKCNFRQIHDHFAEAREARKA